MRSMYVQSFNTIEKKKNCRKSLWYKIISNLYTDWHTDGHMGTWTYGRTDTWTQGRTDRQADSFRGDIKADQGQREYV